MTHRGEIVKKVLTIQGVNLKSLSKQINMNRQTLYNQLEREDMFTPYILKIGEAIKYDFSKLIPELDEEMKDIRVIPETESENIGEDYININIRLDGSEENLEKLITKLRALNTTLSSF